jgi:hypothetical protein
MKMDKLGDILKKGWPAAEVLTNKTEVIPYGEQILGLGGPWEDNWDKRDDIVCQVERASADCAGVTDTVKKLKCWNHKKCPHWKNFKQQMLAALDNNPNKREVWRKVSSALLGTYWPNGEMEKPGEHGDHVRDVVDKMNELLASIKGNRDPNFIANQNKNVTARTAFESSWREIGQLLDSYDFTADFLRIAAFYHDLGKIIQRERHPIIGYHYVTQIPSPDKDALMSMLYEKIETHSLFLALCDIVHFHDLFGVISTGEASPPVLIDVLHFGRCSEHEQRYRLALLAVTNIADIAGTIDLTWEKLRILTDAWVNLDDLIKRVKGNRLEFSNQLIAQEQDPQNTVERIARLLTEPSKPSYYDGTNGAWEKLDTALANLVQIEDTLRVMNSTRFYQFCADFALLCKLDYALRFLQRLKARAAKRIDNGDDANEVARQVTQIVVALLTRLIEDYRALTYHQDGSRRRIGIQVNGWSQTKELAESLVDLLFRDLIRGCYWASEEATAWYID